MKLSLATLFVPLLLLAGCDRPATSSVAAGGASAAAAGIPQGTPIVARSSKQLRIEPAELRDCVPSVANVAWDLSAALPGENAVEVWVGEGASAKLFASGGNRGEAMTGPWTTPGITFSLRLAGETERVAYAIMGGPPCSSPHSGPNP